MMFLSNASVLLDLFFCLAISPLSLEFVAFLRVSFGDSLLFVVDFFLLGFLFMVRFLCYYRDECHRLSADLSMFWKVLMWFFD